MWPAWLWFHHNGYHLFDIGVVVIAWAIGLYASYRLFEWTSRP